MLRACKRWNGSARASRALFHSRLTWNSPRSGWQSRRVLRLQSKWICFLLIAACAEASAIEIKQTRKADAQFIGAVGCKSSSCHGGAGEKRSQYIIWSRQDFHRHAFAILLDARSARIAETVGIAEAQSSARCT